MKFFGKFLFLFLSLFLLSAFYTGASSLSPTSVSPGTTSINLQGSFQASTWNPGCTIGSVNSSATYSRDVVINNITLLDEKGEVLRTYSPSYTPSDPAINEQDCDESSDVSSYKPNYYDWFGQTLSLSGLNLVAGKTYYVDINGFEQANETVKDYCDPGDPACQDASDTCGSENLEACYFEIGDDGKFYGESLYFTVTGGGCQGSDCDPLPDTPSCSPGSQTVYRRDTVSISASGAPTPYSWSAPGSDSGATQTSGDTKSFSTQYASTGNYTVTVTASNGKSANCQVSVISSSEPVATVKVSSNVSTSWSISGPSSFSGSGTSGSYVGAAGTYTINPASLTCYSRTVSPSSSQSVSNGSSITFSITYTYTCAEQPPPPPPPTASCDGAAPQTSVAYATSGGFYIYAYNVQASDGASVAVWSSVNGQDDLVWYPMLYVGTDDQGRGVSRATVDLGAHRSGNPDYGAFAAHVYMHHNGAYVFCATADFMREMPNQDPTGFFDIAGCNYLEGWAYDPDTPNSEIQVHVYANGSLVANSSTNVPRPDVNSSLGVSGNHGFSIAVPTSLKNNTNQSISIYAINTPTGGNPELYNSPRTINCAPAPAPTVSISANPTTAYVGERALIDWSSANADSCTVTASNGSVNWSGTGGSQYTPYFTSAGTITYTSNCTGAGGSGSDSDSVSVSVNPFNYSLSNSGNANVTKTSSNAYTQSTVTKTLSNGISEPVTVSVSGHPSGVSYSASNNPCNPNCFSTITFTVSPSAPIGNFPITVTGSPLNKTTGFNLNITGAPISASCSASPTTAELGEAVTFSATVSGGTAPLTYSWSGTNIPTSPAPSSNPYNRSYSTIGTKTAQLTVTDADGLQTTCPEVQVQINFNPEFEEF